MKLKIVWGGELKGTLDFFFMLALELSIDPSKGAMENALDDPPASLLAVLSAW